MLALEGDKLVFIAEKKSWEEEKADHDK